jgi:hypothetical protein
MSLLKTTNDNILREDGAGGSVGGGAVAAFAMPLFTSLVQRTTAPAPKVIKYSKRKKEKKNNLGIREAFQKLSENDPTSTGTNSFDTTNVIAKLKSLEGKEKTDAKDTTTFGLEDDNGGLVRVTIKNDQAADFEKALQAYMSDVEDDEEIPEIAEMLFDLKDRFDIVDVVWPDVVEDEEQEQGLNGQPADGGADGGVDLGLGGAEGGEGAEGGLEGGADLENLGGAEGGEDAGSTKDLLTQVIDMMKADAEARKAEARAKEAEAKGREAEAMTHQANSKVKQEEQMLDMDSYYKSQKDESKEAKRLAQLARWKHEMGGEGDDEDSGGGDSGGGSMSMPQRGGGHEEEEIHRGPAKIAKQPPHKGSTIRGRVHPHDIAEFILGRVK